MEIEERVRERQKEKVWRRAVKIKAWDSTHCTLCVDLMFQCKLGLWLHCHYLRTFKLPFNLWSTDSTSIHYIYPVYQKMDTGHPYLYRNLECFHWCTLPYRHCLVPSPGWERRIGRGASNLTMEKCWKNIPEKIITFIFHDQMVSGCWRMLTVIYRDDSRVVIVTSSWHRG